VGTIEDRRIGPPQKQPSEGGSQLVRKLKAGLRFLVRPFAIVLTLFVLIAIVAFIAFKALDLQVKSSDQAALKPEFSGSPKEFLYLDSLRVASYRGAVIIPVAIYK
jgi:hypothetical protein